MSAADEAACPGISEGRMTNVVVVFPKQESAERIRGILQRNGYIVRRVCQSGTAALQEADLLGEGIVVCGCRLPDMNYEQLRERLPETFDMLLVASEASIPDGPAAGVTWAALPLRIRELLSLLDEITERQADIRRTRKLPQKRSEREQELIGRAKQKLMKRNRMTEAEAHRYLQKTSMDSGTGLTETAQMILRLMGEDPQI